MDPLEEDERGKLLVRRLGIAAAALELIYIGLIVWEQAPEWKREQIKSRIRARVGKLVSPCVQCREDRKLVNRTIWEATEIVEARSWEGDES